MPQSKLHVLFPEQGESWHSFIARIERKKGKVVVIISGDRDADLVHHEKECQHCLQAIENKKDFVLATHNKSLILMAHSRGITVIEKEKELKTLLKGHPKNEEALREFLPHVWRQELRSKLQAIGLLSLPKLRVWSLIIASCIVFFFIFFRLLPSAEIVVAPRETTIIQTSNIFLVQSGATVDEVPLKVRKMDLIPIEVRIDKTITFDQISKEFTGKSASMDMKIVNFSTETYRLFGKSRVSNLAGMVFRLQDPVIIDPGQEVIVRAIAEDEDLYDDIIGERGNVPVGLRWDFPGLSPEERQLVYGTNVQAGRGGETRHRLVLSQKDIDIAKRQIKQQLLSEANQLIDEKIIIYNAENSDKVLTRLYYDELTNIEFVDFVLPTEFINQKIQSVPVQGSVLYKAFAYDSKYVLDLLTSELKTHIEENKELIMDSVDIDRLVTHVIDYHDDLAWIKLTVDLSGTERAILDPLTPYGARFAKDIREKVIGKTRSDALRIVKNLVEVEKATISIWPPWTRSMPEIPYNISLQITP